MPSPKKTAASKTPNARKTAKTATHSKKKNPSAKAPALTRQPARFKPGSTGFEFLEKARQHPDYPDMAVRLAGKPDGEPWAYLNRLSDLVMRLRLIEFLTAMKAILTVCKGNIDSVCMDWTQGFQWRPPAGQGEGRHWNVIPDTITGDRRVLLEAVQVWAGQPPNWPTGVLAHEFVRELSFITTLTEVNKRLRQLKDSADILTELQRMGLEQSLPEARISRTPLRL
jgi:hypothetical protein